MAAFLYATTTQILLGRGSKPTQTAQINVGCSKKVIIKMLYLKSTFRFDRHFFTLSKLSNHFKTQFKSRSSEAWILESCSRGQELQRKKRASWKHKLSQSLMVKEYRRRNRGKGHLWVNSQNCSYAKKISPPLTEETQPLLSEDVQLHHLWYVRAKVRIKQTAHLNTRKDQKIGKGAKRKAGEPSAGASSEVRKHSGHQ